ncbi:MAG: CTP synthase [Candidatus Pacebacteria bacterium]|nr:CTP synthase [Candidatus Paceibacterota bacterium]
MKNHKYIFVTGGVMSGIGKGITASSIGKILQARGLKITAIKIDPYVNVDAGTMNPTEHGEVAVLNDGYETDQDMLNYERFLNIDLPNINYMTTGRVYLSVIEKERNLEYKGKCVQVVPHVPLEIIERIEKAAKMADADVTVIEIGGTVGEYENVLFLEAARMLKNKYPKDVMYTMLSYLPIPSNIGEMKTKPTQHAVRNLNAVGIQPDILVARSDVSLDKKRKEKIALFCNIDANNVVSAPDVESIYDVPLNFEKDKISDLIVEKLNLQKRVKKSNLNTWKNFVKKIHNGGKQLDIAIVGKYFDSGDFFLSDAYISVIEAVKFSCYKIDCKPKIHWLNSKEFESAHRGGTGNLKLSSLKKYDGVIVPGGFGSSGIDGKLKVIQYVRENKIPFLGLCYGMQLAVIEYARNVLKMKDANTVEIDPKTKYPVIDIMPEQKELMKNKDYGGTMRLGAYPAILKKGTIARKAYGKDKISERHRHRFEVNPDFIDKLISKDLIFSGTSPDGKLMEILELGDKNSAPSAANKSKGGKNHPFFVATQFHPEYKARPLNPHPIFTEFLKACKKQNK